VSGHETTRVSRQLYQAVKLSDEPAYRIAQRAEISPSILSKLMHEPVMLAVSKARAMASVCWRGDAEWQRRLLS